MHGIGDNPARTAWPTILYVGSRKVSRDHERLDFQTFENPYGLVDGESTAGIPKSATFSRVFRNG